MLIEFSVTNFRSFKEKQTLSFLPSGKIRKREIQPLSSKKYDKLAVLPTVVIYGANNSGKSNLLKAIKALDWLVGKSGNFNSDQLLLMNDFFAFNTTTKNQPTLFEIDFVAPDDNRYSYFVEIDHKKILREELYTYNISETGKITTIALYKRKEQEIKFPRLKGKKESISFQHNQLFLSRADIEGNEQLKKVYSFFANHLYVYQFSENEYTDFLTRAYKDYINDEKNKNSLMPSLIEKVLQEIDTRILGLETSMVDVSKIQFPDNIPQDLKDKIFENIKSELRTKHQLFDEENREIGIETLALEEQSVGTRKILGLLPLVFSGLKDGDTVLIDEMNTSIHTNLSMWIIELFNNTKTNPNNAQLIITTHDISLIGKHLYERDQIYVIEKDKYAASELYSFADITGISNKRNRLADYYETGRLGGVPHIATAYLEDKITQYINDGAEVE